MDPKTVGVSARGAQGSALCSRCAEPLADAAAPPPCPRCDAAPAAPAAAAARLAAAPPAPSPLDGPIRRCLILAAGAGTRLNGLSGCKPLLPVAGLPLLERAIATAQRAGLNDFYVVTGHDAPRVEAFLAALARRRRLAITPIRHDGWREGNGSSLLSARQWLDGPFVLLMADHVFDDAILSGLLAAPAADADVILAADFRLHRNALIDPDEATKVSTTGDRIVAIGKTLEDYQAYDSGIFLCTPALFAAAEASLRAGDGSLSAAIRRLAADGRARVHDLGNHAWLDVDTPHDRATAEALLYAGLDKPLDGWVSRRINRPLSRRIVTPLLLRAAPAITPNQVSLLSFGVALAAALGFAFGQPLAAAVGLQLASVLDGSDGEIARLKKLETRFGGFLDAVLDRYADSFILAGLAYFAWNAPGNASLLGAALAPVIAIAAALAITGTLMVSYTSAKALSDFGYRYQGRWTAAGRGRDWRLMLLFLGGLLAAAHPFSAVVALGAIALLTNGIVLRRIGISASRAQGPTPINAATTRAVVFDLDGTLADTMPFLSRLAVRLMVRHYGLPPAEAAERYWATTGMDFASQIAETFPAHAANAEVIEAFEQAKRGAIVDQPLFPAAVPALQALQAQGIQRFVVSSTSEAMVAAYVRRHRLEPLLNDVLGLTPDLNKAGQLQLILRTHGLRPAEVIFVGDSLRDAGFAAQAGIPFVGVCHRTEAATFRAWGLASVPGLGGLTGAAPSHDRGRDRAWSPGGGPSTDPR